MQPSKKNKSFFDKSCGRTKIINKRSCSDYVFILALPIKNTIFIKEPIKLYLQLFIVIIVLCFLNVTVYSQSPFFHAKELPGQIKQVGFNTVFEDQSGRIYIGSDIGLLFYDGQNILKIPVRGDSIIAVTSIYQTNEKSLLVGCNNGLIFKLDQGILQPFRMEEGYPNVRITGFQEDTKGRLWLATYGEGAYFFEENRWYNIEEEEGLLGNDIYVIESGANGQIWLGTDGGISICSFENGKKFIRNITKDEGLPDDIVYEIHADEQGHFWIGMYDNGICRFNVEKDTFDFSIEEWNGGIVTCLELFEGEELWIGTEGKGVFRYLIPEKTLKPVNNNIDFSKSKVKDLLKDVEGNIWVLDNIHKLASANKQFERFGVPTKQIQSLLIDEKHTLWMGTEQGLFCWEQFKEYELEERLNHKNLNVTSLFEDAFENIWIGTFGDGIYLYHEATKSINHFTEEDGLTNNSVLSIDGLNGKIWLATLGGVTEINTEHNLIQSQKLETRNFNHSNGLGTNFIYKVFVDSKQRVWFGTDGKGLSVLEKGSINNFREINVDNEKQVDTINLKTIYAITEDQQGNIWFSTSKNGVFKFDGQRFHQLSLKEELNQMTISNLISNGQRDIIAVYPSGVAVLNPETNHLIYYDHEVGLKDFNPNLNVGTVDEYGNVWFADHAQVIKYLSIQEKLEIHPRTILSELVLNYQPIPFSNYPNFSFDQNNIVFRYLGLWYTAPEKVKFKYRLKGYNPAWIYSKDNQVSYSSLLPGDYSFEVIATANEVFHNEPVSTFSFTIRKPFWRQAWFLLLSTMLLLIGAYAFIKIRDRRKQRVNELQKEKLYSQLATLKAQINPHFLFNSFNTLAALIDENKEAAVEYVERLSDFYRSMLQYRDVDVIPIQEEIEIVKDYTFLLKKRFGENFNISVNINGTPAYLAPLSLQTLVENAVKHNIISKAKPLTVSIDIEEGKYVVVSNNIQRKLQTERSTNFGLQSLMRQYELLGKQKIKIVESKDYFKVGLPIIK